MIVTDGIFLLPTGEMIGVVKRAETLWLNTNNDEIGLDELTLALLEEHTTAVYILKMQGVNLSPLKNTLRHRLGLPSSRVGDKLRFAIELFRHCVLKQKVKREGKSYRHSAALISVLTRSYEEAASLSHMFVSTEHVLLGLLIQSTGPLVDLRHSGVDYDTCRNTINKIYG
jgi:ATP-dependent Clp protease ATP-binding subunit ClpA